MNDPRDADEPRERAAAARRLVRDGYDRASQAYRGDTFEYAGSAYQYWLERFIARLPQGARVLDLGCGNGLPVARELARRGFVVTGMDLSAVQVERARVLVPSAHFECADMTEAPLGESRYDGVVAFHSIINVPLAEQPALVRRMQDALVPGGTLLLTAGQEPWTGIEQHWRGVRDVAMFYAHAGAATYREWLMQAGAQIDEQGRTPQHGEPGYAVFLARRA